MSYIDLSEVTLVAATSVDMRNTQLALLKSTVGINYGSVKMLCSEFPRYRHPLIEYVLIPRMDVTGYSRFMIEDLYRYIDTPYCLVVQSDGYVLSPQCWRDEFLDYDYIGAPWLEQVAITMNDGMNVSNQIVDMGTNRVGNGGFSLRSKKLLEITARLLKYDDLDFLYKGEDFVICHYFYREMIGEGVKFAPLSLAAQFSIESEQGVNAANIDNVFGFHGKYWHKVVLEQELGRSQLAG